MRKLITFLALILISANVIFSQGIVFESNEFEIMYDVLEDELIEKATSIAFYEESCLILQENHAENYKLIGEWDKEEMPDGMLYTIMSIKDDVEWLLAFAHNTKHDYWIFSLYRPDASIIFYGEFKNNKTPKLEKKPKGANV